MRRLMIALAAVALSACVQDSGQVPTSPGQVASHTVADDIARQDAEQLYKLSRTILEALADARMADGSRVLKGANAAKAADLDAKLKEGLAAVRTAYDTFNSANLLVALANVRTLSRQVDALAGAR